MKRSSKKWKEKWRGYLKSVFVKSSRKFARTFSEALPACLFCGTEQLFLFIYRQEELLLKEHEEMQESLKEQKRFVSAKVVSVFLHMKIVLFLRSIVIFCFNILAELASQLSNLFLVFYHDHCIYYCNHSCFYNEFRSAVWNVIVHLWIANCRRLEEMREAFQNEKQNFEAQEEQRRATLSTRKKKFFWVEGSTNLILFSRSEIRIYVWIFPPHNSALCRTFHVRDFSLSQPATACRLHILLYYKIFELLW